MEVQTLLKRLALCAGVWFLLRQLIWHKYRVLARIPGPATQLLVGNALQIQDKKNINGGGTIETSTLIQWVRQFPRMMLVWLGPVSPVVVISHPEVAKEVLRQPSAKAALYDFLVPWLGRGLLTSWGDKWKLRRRLLTPAFHFDILKDFVEIFGEQTEVMLKKWEKRAEKQEEFDMFPDVTHCALDIICLSAFGKSINAQEHSDTPYIRAVYSGSELIWERILSPWYWSDALYFSLPKGKTMAHDLGVLKGFTREVIRTRRVEYERNGAQREGRMAFLDMLFTCKDDQGQPLTDDALQEEVDTFMFEGHDTTSAGITWTLFLLARNPDVQKRAQEEVDRVFGDALIPTHAQLEELEYVGWVIKESNRMLPPVPIMARKIAEDMVLNGYTIPGGSEVAVIPVLLHYNEEVWPNPFKFDPERFSPENSKGRHPFAHIPFSAGPRNCIGQNFAILEEKMLVASVLKRFTISTNVVNPKPLPELILRPAEGIPITLKRR